MAIERQISIKKNASGTSPRVTFDPNPLAASAGDEIFWTNDDSEPHWPGRPNADGTINTTFFIPNQIAPGGDTSASFAPMVSGTLGYVCSLPGHRDETGCIVIS